MHRVERIVFQHQAPVNDLVDERQSQALLIKDAALVNQHGFLFEGLTEDFRVHLAPELCEVHRAQHMLRLR